MRPGKEACNINILYFSCFFFYLHKVNTAYAILNLLTYNLFFFLEKKKVQKDTEIVYPVCS